jgi:hypothetical protein
MNHPMQPIEKSEGGVFRYKSNKIIDYLYEKGVIDLNEIACQEFDADDRTQFAQLTGYSVDGAADLSYFDKNVTVIADNIVLGNISQDESPTEVGLRCRVKELETVIENMKEILDEI